MPGPAPAPAALDGQELILATKRFAEVVKPLVSRIQRNEDESLTLAALRDALLPKLLSGELRVPTAEKLAEARA